MGMKNRLTQKMREAEESNSKLFCAYVTLGFPKLSATEALIPALERAGTDIIELGFPFSDPLADGPTIQYASEQSIKQHVTLKDAFSLLRKLRRKGLKIPVLFFSYFNPIMHYGVSRAIRQLHQSGFDGLIVPDLPLEEGRMWESWFRRFDLSVVYLIAPTTRTSRMAEIARRSNGFVYYVSLRGVTGARTSVPSDLLRNVKAIRKVTEKPILVGFGISNKVQAKRIGRVADGIIVGSAIVERLRKGRKAVKSVAAFASGLIRSLKQT
ncbi:MAG: tryptophan synthase subunit alpha [Candidatus Omnitrophica bacterium]|nr:tryptophan synthase subunit alpha [Candidatus Omnitrophota bacterium]